MIPKTFSSFLITLGLATLLPLSGAEPTPAAENAKKALSRLVIEPSSTSLHGGKVHLITTPLDRRSQTFVGSYRIKVIPYVFKNEDGSILVNVPEASLRQLHKGSVMQFDGRATTTGTGEEHPLLVRATATSEAAGSITISISTENGPLVFSTSYRFET